MRVASIVLGLILVGLAAVWFLTPYQENIRDLIGLHAEPHVRGAGDAPGADWEMVNTILNAANAFFGALGVFLTLRGVRKA